MFALSILDIQQACLLPVVFSKVIGLISSHRDTILSNEKIAWIVYACNFRANRQNFTAFLNFTSFLSEIISANKTFFNPLTIDHFRSGRIWPIDWQTFFWFPIVHVAKSFNIKRAFASQALVVSDSLYLFTLRIFHLETKS